MAKAHIYTVSEITRYIKRLVEKDDTLQDIWVKGEISNFKSSLKARINSIGKARENSIVEKDAKKIKKC